MRRLALALVFATALAAATAAQDAPKPPEQGEKAKAPTGEKAKPPAEGEKAKPPEGEKAKPPAEGEKPEEKKYTLDDAKKLLADYSAEFDAYGKFFETYAATDRELSILKARAEEAQRYADRTPKDPGARQAAEGLNVELQKAIEKAKRRMPELKARNETHFKKFFEIVGAVDSVLKEHPDDGPARIFKVKVMAKFGLTTMITAEAANLYRLFPQDRDVCLAFAQSQLALPADNRNPQDPRHDPGRAPRFEHVYEALGPFAKAEPTDESIQLMFGVAACALGKDAEAKQALDSVAHVGSIASTIRILIGNPQDPEAAFGTWREVASGLVAKPDDVDLHQKRAILLFQCRANKYAIADCEAIAKARPESTSADPAKPPAWQLLFSCFFGPEPSAVSNSYERALADFQEIAAKNPKDENMHGLLALLLYSSNRIAEAKAELSKLDHPAQILKEVVDAKAEDWTDELAEREKDEKRDNPRVLLETEKGKITLELFEDAAPNTVANFLDLVSKGFYDGIFFHRVINGFMAQGGDPDANGRGGPGYCIKDEAAKNPRLHWRGTLSMAKTNLPDTGGSQFFLCHKPCPSLNHIHTVFGRVLDGQEAVDELQIGDKIKKATVIRKRGHDYVPETIPPGRSWKPAKQEKQDK